MQSASKNWAAALVATTLSLGANAGVTVAKLADYDGPLHGQSSTFPFDLGVIGTFQFNVPAGATINAATFSGTYGTATGFSLSTAGFDVGIEGAQFTVCQPMALGCWVDAQALRPFAFALPSSTYLGLADGSASLEVIQTNHNYVRLGSPTLSIEYTPQVPEPASLRLMALGLAAMGWGFLESRRQRARG